MQEERPHIVERFLGIFADVRRGEGAMAMLLTLNLFILLTAYLVIKTVREVLILTGGGAEVKSYAAAGQALLLFLVVPLYGAFSSKVNRIKLINWVTLFFISNLVVFYVLAHLQVPLGVPFYLWVGIFNLLVVAQFWSFANDVYTQEQGERLFAIVAFGGSLGAILGPMVARWLFAPLGAYQLMLVSAALLGITMVIANMVNAREKDGQCTRQRQTAADKPLAPGGGFKLVIKRRYLLLIALLMVIANLVNTTGEFVLGKQVIEEARRAVAEEEQQAKTKDQTAQLTAAQKQKNSQRFVGAFYAEFFFWVNLVGALVQLFLVSRILKFLGVNGALFFLPFIALTGYSLIAVFPVLSYILVAKVLENSTDYSLQNTARQALFLPTSREAKYKAKAAIDTFFVRIGDVLSAAVVFVGSYFLMRPQHFALINVSLVLFWLLLVWFIGQRYQKLTLAGVHTVPQVPA